jgi:hypothetical protein
MKYVLFAVNPDAIPTCRIFDEFTNHSEIVREVQGQSPGLQIVSAGKCHHAEGKWTCISGSVTLGLSFNLARSVEDEAMLQILSKSI